MPLFQFAIIKKPTGEEQKKGAQDELLVAPTPILAKDINTATLLAGRKIPENVLDILDRIEVAVRPF